MPRVLLLATMSITFCRFLCLSFSPASPTLLHCPLRPLGRMRNQHLVMDCRCVTCQAEFAVSLYLSLSLSICLSLSLSLSLVIYLHPVYLGMLWPWFVNLPLAFCMIAWHFRCKTLNRMPLSPAFPPLPFHPLYRTPYRNRSVYRSSFTVARQTESFVCGH